MWADCDERFRRPVHRCLAADRARRTNSAIRGSNNQATGPHEGESPWQTTGLGHLAPSQDTAAPSRKIEKQIFRWLREGFRRFARLLWVGLISGTFVGPRIEARDGSNVGKRHSGALPQ